MKNATETTFAEGFPIPSASLPLFDYDQSRDEPANPYSGTITTYWKGKKSWSIHRFDAKNPTTQRYESFSQLVSGYPVFATVGGEQ